MQSANRRSFITRCALAATASVAFPYISRAAARRDKPNILLIWTDQQRPDTLAAYGNPRINTPNLDALAKQSCVFEKSYVTQPVCTPSRSSVMSGLWPH